MRRLKARTMNTVSIANHNKYKKGRARLLQQSRTGAWKLNDRRRTAILAGHIGLLYATFAIFHRRAGLAFRPLTPFSRPAESGHGTRETSVCDRRRDLRHGGVLRCVLCSRLCIDIINTQLAAVTILERSVTALPSNVGVATRGSGC